MRLRNICLVFAFAAIASCATTHRSNLATTPLPTGVDLHYRELGDPADPPLILLHGYTDSWFSWSLVLDELADEYAPELDHVATLAIAPAALLDEALETGDGRVLQRYPRQLEAEYGLYFKVARLFAQVIGRPVLMRELTRVGMQSRTLMDWVLRIMANLLREDELGPAEAAYKAASQLARVIPEPGRP